MRLAISAVIVSGLMMVSGPVQANSQPFNQWLQQFKAEASQQGIRPEVLDAAFKGVEPNEKVLRLDRKQPEGTTTFPQYRERVVSEARIKEGRAMLAKHKSLLERIGRHFGVQPRFIVALWGVETSYGKITGGFSIVEALATLAYDGRRADFFRDELMKALKIINDGHISADAMKGSWAGAMGQSQFMPSSFLNFAYDYNGDGKRDIWGTQGDVFASIANYLARSGWSDDLTWGRAVKLPNNFPDHLMGRDVKKTIPEWQALGVRKLDGGALPSRSIPASIVIPDGSPHAYMTYGNYDVLMRWNRSLYFATSVGMLSDAIGY